MKWESSLVDDSAVDVIARELDLKRPVASAIVGRGIDNLDTVQSYINPRLANLTDPFDVPGMANAVPLIWAAINNNHKISVFGDYDADGVTSTALLTMILRELGGDVTPFLPRRLEDGYGLSVGAVDRCIQEQTPNLIVTVDCGICSAEAVEFAKNKGVIVVVSDHHEVTGVVSPADAVVNPKLGDDEPLKQLAGVGVAFKVCHGLVKQGLTEKKTAAADIDLRCWLDLVALGTVADIVPLSGENRIMVRYGLGLMGSDSVRPGIKALLNVAGVKKEISCYHIGFVVGPRVNAAGRLGCADNALELLLTNDTERAAELAAILDSTNSDRKKIESIIVSEAVKEIKGYFDESSVFGIVAARRGWHEGTIGIVASRLCSLYNRPSVVVAIGDDGEGKGSCRSIGLIDMLEVLEGCSDLLLTYGGHKMAAGLSVKESNIEEFSKRFNSICAEQLRGADLRPVLRIDSWITLSEADMAMLKSINMMRPFGQGNTTPVWGARNITLVGKPKPVGSKGAHLKMVMASGGTQMDAIAFGMGDYDVPEGELDVVFNLQEDTYRGGGRLQLYIKDIGPSEK